MEIKKITKTIEEVVGYVAFDGTEFKEKEECEKYERTANAVIVQRFIKITVKELEEVVITGDGNNYLGSGCGDDWYDALIKIENEDDLKAAQMYQNLVEHPKYPYERKFTNDDIGKELVVSIGEHHEHCYIYGTIDECVDAFRKAIMQFKAID